MHVNETDLHNDRPDLKLAFCRNFEGGLFDPEFGVRGAWGTHMVLALSTTSRLARIDKGYPLGLREPSIFLKLFRSPHPPVWGGGGGRRSRG